MYTIFDEEKGEFLKVEEPDASLTYSYADYAKWKFEERLELIRGKIFRMSAPGTTHQQISIRLSSRLYNFLDRHPCQVFSAPFDVRLPMRNGVRDEEITTVVQPDICVICDNTKLDERGCCGAPDLVIEILSPGNSKRELQLKYGLYEEAGVREYWVIHPAERSVSAFLLQSDGKFTDAKKYTSRESVHSTVIDGFEISPDWLFS